MVSDFMSLRFSGHEEEREGSWGSKSGVSSYLCPRAAPTCHPNVPCKGRPKLTVMPTARPNTPHSSRPSSSSQRNKAHSTTNCSPSRGPSPARDATLRQDVRTPIDPLSQVRTSLVYRLPPHKCKDTSTNPSLSHSKSSSAQQVPSNYPMPCDREARAAHTLSKTMRRVSMPPCPYKRLHHEPTPMILRART